MSYMERHSTCGSTPQAGPGARSASDLAFNYPPTAATGPGCPEAEHLRHGRGLPQGAP